jgi:hypothetical protein
MDIDLRFDDGMQITKTGSLNGFELSRPACFFDSFSSVSI